MTVPELVTRTSASLLVTDMSPLRIGRQWRSLIADAVQVPFHEARGTTSLRTLGVSEHIFCIFRVLLPLEFSLFASAGTRVCLRPASARAFCIFFSYPASNGYVNLALHMWQGV